MFQWSIDYSVSICSQSSGKLILTLLLFKEKNNFNKEKLINVPFHFASINLMVSAEKLFGESGQRKTMDDGKLPMP